MSEKIKTVTEAAAWCSGNGIGPWTYISCSTLSPVNTEMGDHITDIASQYEVSHPGQLSLSPHSGRTSVFGRRTYPVLPTQPIIPSGSIDE